MRRPGAGLAGALLLAVLPLAGCVAVPDSGPVVDADAGDSVDTEQASARDALPPEKGATTVEVVSGFLDAMQAWPVDVGVAKEYLDQEAASSWNPEASTITYTDNLPPQDDSNRVSVQLSGAERIDARGSWRGPLPERAQQLGFDLVLEDGEYRISDPPDALVVPAAWFAQRYQQVSLYFFDPTGRVLVPEPVFVPQGQQLVSTLTERLLEGPRPAPRGTTRTYLPPGLSVGLSVTVSEDGLADIALTGSQVPQAADDVDRMLAQLAWTLRQEPAVRAFRVSVGGTPVPLPDGGREYAVGAGQEFDPNGYLADTSLFALRDGLLVRGDVDGGLGPATGPWGTRVPGVRSVDVDLAGTRVAGVSQGGGALLTAPLGDVPRRRQGTTTVIADGTDLLRPVWDGAGRLWVVDRTGTGARVRYVQGGRVRDLQVPGVTGRQVGALLVSRDGTRLAAVVSEGGVDQVRVGRIVVDGRGQVVRATPTATILEPAEDTVRIRDIGWTSPTSIAVLSQVVRDEVYEISTVPVDGAPTTSESALSTTLSGEVRGLAVSPVPGLGQYAITPDGVVDLEASTRITVRDPVASLGYVG